MLFYFSKIITLASDRCWSKKRIQLIFYILDESSYCEDDWLYFGGYCYNFRYFQKSWHNAKVNVHISILIRNVWDISITFYIPKSLSDWWRRKLQHENNPFWVFVCEISTKWQKVTTRHPSTVCISRQAYKQYGNV